MFKVFMKLVNKYGLERAESLFRLSPAFKSASQMRTYRIMAMENRERALRAGRGRRAKPAKTFRQRKAARTAKPTTKQARENYMRRQREIQLRDRMLGETGVPMSGHREMLRRSARRRALDAASSPQTLRQEGSPVFPASAPFSESDNMLLRAIREIYKRQGRL
tara:strand:- start:863 stop:1354 length:492 start_codon:yes stop_codon:yes gene_type:complete